MVILGTVDRMSSFSQRIRVQNCGIHPGFSSDGPIMYYDIAFCTLQHKIDFDDDKVSANMFETIADIFKSEYLDL